MHYLLSITAFVLLSFVSSGQTPEAIKYQAIARDHSGSILGNKEITFRISFLKNGTNGPIAYSEKHLVTSNEFGLVNFDLGKGMALEGSFQSIDWSLGVYFMEVAIDSQGGSSFEIMGNTQLLSVPYALYAKTSANGFSGNYADLSNKPELFNGNYGSLMNKPTKLSDFTNDQGFIANASESLLKLTNDQRDQLVDPPIGTVIVNISTGCLNLKNSHSWFEICGTCIPQPTQANAGNDQSEIFESVTLNANYPTSGTGTWSKISGTGGEFTDVTKENTSFSGIAGQNYTLRWTISNNCGSSHDDVQISFSSNEPNIGSIYGGGIVFYKFPEGGGLVAALSDQSSGAPWGCYGTLISQLTNGFGAGSANTAQIVSQCSEVGIAARICDELDLNGFTDWYLPTSTEMYEMTQALTTSQLGFTSGHEYWTSTQNNDQYVTFVTINGAGVSYPKTNLLRVRAIRRFAPVGN